MIKRQESIGNPKTKGTDIFDDEELKFENSEICGDTLFKDTRLLLLVTRSI